MRIPRWLRRPTPITQRTLGTTRIDENGKPYVSFTSEEASELRRRLATRLVAIRDTTERHNIAAAWDKAAK